MNHARPEVEVEGVPVLELQDESRAAFEDLVAELLIAAIEGQHESAGGS